MERASIRLPSVLRKGRGEALRGNDRCANRQRCPNHKPHPLTHGTAYTGRPPAARTDFRSRARILIALCEVDQCALQIGRVKASLQRKSVQDADVRTVSTPRRNERSCDGVQACRPDFHIGRRLRQHRPPLEVRAIRPVTKSHSSYLQRRDLHPDSDEPGGGGGEGG